MYICTVHVMYWNCCNFVPRLSYFYFLGQHLIQRCVIVQRDDKGYGLTVTGDNPVYVQFVIAG